ncbi:MAG: thioredoxin family protein [Spirochaetes bacterium]|nr:thioredoxin family protein [Spirochaetota bacterium]
MKIQLLGTNCDKCTSLEANIKKAIDESEVKIQFIKIDDIKEIMDLGIDVTPALALNGVVKSSGKVLSVEEIKNLIIDETEVERIENL